MVGSPHSTSFDLIIPAPVPAGLFSLSVAESQAPGGIISLRCWYPRPGRADVITPVLQVKKDFLELSGLFKVTEHMSEAEPGLGPKAPDSHPHP